MFQRNRQNLVGPAGIVIPVLAVDHIIKVAGARIPEARVERLARAACRLGKLTPERPRLPRSTQRSSSRSALYQSALISTALPRRGVTTQSPTLASIQVSW